MAQSSFQFTQEVLNAFLERPEPGILAIKGKWGVGKTYLWKEMVKSFDAEKTKTVAYVSLFGVTSIAELRRMIVARRAPFPKITTPKKLLKPLTKATTLLRYVDGGFIKNTELMAEAIEDSVLRDVVVCIDDLERKEPSLSEQTLLGFLTGLRDEKDCKVVLLFNEEAASSTDAIGKTLSEYREKVIDHEVALQPTAAECFDLVFHAHTHPREPAENDRGFFLMMDNRSTRQICIDAELANIRVLRRIREALVFFGGKLKKAYPFQWPFFERQLVKLHILHFIHGSKFRVSEVVGQNHWIRIHMDQDKNGKRGKETERFQPVFDIGYHPTETDQIVVDFLTTGYVNFDLYQSSLTKVEEGRKRDTLNTKLRENWSLLWDNFQATGEKFASEQTEFFRTNYDKIGLQELSQFLGVAKDLEIECPEVRGMLDRKINDFVEQTKDLNQFDSSLTGVTESVAARVRQALAIAIPAKKPISEVIHNMTDRNGWSSEEIKFLVGYSAEDFYQWLLASKEPQLLSNLKTFMERIGEGSAAESVRKAFEIALRRIASRSKTDEFRVRVGIHLSTVPSKNEEPKSDQQG